MPSLGINTAGFFFKNLSICSSLINPLNIDFQANFFDIAAAFIATLMLVFITANKLYNKSAGLALMVILALVVQNSLA